MSNRIASSRASAEPLVKDIRNANPLALSVFPVPSAPRLLSISIASEGAFLPTDQRLVRLPDDLLRRFRRTVPARARSAFVRQLLEKALPSEDDDNDKLYLAALGAERDTRLSAEMAAWEEAMVGDRFERGCGQLTAPDRHGRAALDRADAAAACHRVGPVGRS